jgi:hypothetical protein
MSLKRKEKKGGSSTATHREGGSNSEAHGIVKGGGSRGRQHAWPTEVGDSR